MPFTVGQYLTANDLKSQEDAHSLGYGVVNGLKVIPTGPPDMDVHVEIGKAYVADTLVEKGAVTDLAVGAADPTNPRKDIVVCNSAGTLSIVAGTPEAALPNGNVGVYTLNPEPPNIPANSIILAEIWVPAGAAAITGDEIYDKRVSIADFLTHKDAATGVHGVGASTVCSETEADGKITTHKNIASAHHAKTTSASELTSGVLPSIARLPALATGKIWQGNANRPVEVDSPSIPSGLITMWHGTIVNIPAGYVICDGNNSTPNLLARFIEGVATAATNPGAIGGATGKTTSSHYHSGPSHVHSGPSHRHTTPAMTTGPEPLDHAKSGPDSYWVSRREHEHPIAANNTGYGGTQNTGAGGTGNTGSKTASISDIRPKYYDIAFLMKT